MNQRLVNVWDQLMAAGGDRVAICYDTQDVGRGGHPAKWHILRLMDGKEIKTDPTGPWYNYGRKTFIVGRRAEKAPQFEAARTWVIQQFGPHDFVSNKRGDFVDRGVQERFPLPPRKRSK